MRVLALPISALGGGGSRAGGTPDPRAEEQALVARAQGGGLDAFEELYRRNVQRVNALCRRLATSDAAAEEMVQEVFVRAWARLRGFRGDCSFATWLYPLAVHLALDERRARRRGAWLTAVDDVEALERARPARGHEDGLGTGFDLERALRALPPRARAVFVLHDIEGHQHEEIAAMMEIDPGTSKSQLHRARRLLREALK
jgi:RNA polymerase sigma-70 factor (ECF subfamily)